MLIQKVMGPRFVVSNFYFTASLRRLLQQNRHFASFRGDAAIQSLSERSGYSASRAHRTGFMSTRPGASARFGAVFCTPAPGLSLNERNSPLFVMSIGG